MMKRLQLFNFIESNVDLENSSCATDLGNQKNKVKQATKFTSTRISSLAYKLQIKSLITIPI